MLRIHSPRAAGARILFASILLGSTAAALAQATAPMPAPAAAATATPAPRPPPGRFNGEAPVPAAVAMPRPTPAEVDAARAGFASLLASADPALRGLLQKYPTLIDVRPVRNTAIVPSLSPGFEVKHRANMEVAKQGDAELLLMGDSITDFWRNPTGNYAGKPVLDKYFGQWKIANFGIAGDTTQGVLHRLQDGEGKGFSPRAIMLMIGTNNSGSNTAAEIAEGVGAVVLALQNSFPQAKILLLGIFPRGKATDPVRTKLADINRSIAKLHDGERVQYLDIGAGFLDSNGDIPADVMSDGLHPSTKGYEIWAQAVKEPLAKLMAR
jgi:beta-glucosidase